MLLNRPSTSLLRYLAPAVLLFSVFYLFYTSDRFSLATFRSPILTKEQSKARFIQNVLDNDIDGPIDLEPLAEVCRKAEWQEGLIVKCDAIPGGIGNVRNMFLNCIRFAIEAGATGLVIPECKHRNDNDLSDIFTQNFSPISFLLDTTFFTQAFNTACPQIKLYPTDADLPMNITRSLLDKHRLAPQDLSSRLDYFHLIDMPIPQWRTAFNLWLHNETHYPSLSTSSPGIVFFANSLLRWPFKYDAPSFIAHFGRILRTREDARRIAAALLWSMSEKYVLNLDFSRQELQKDRFMGVHLRTAADAIKVGWPNYTTQAANYLHAANRTRTKLIYLTTGAPEDAARFNESAYAQNNIVVISKETLLQKPDLEDERRVLGSMAWDQHALVDFEVLLRSSYFVGMFESSFAWNIALRRHVVVGNGTWVDIGVGRMGVEGLEGEEGTEEEAFRDQFSSVFGPRDLGIRWTFPLGLYP